MSTAQNQSRGNWTALAAWGVLVFATLATSWLADTEAFSVGWATTVILLVAAFKARVIALHYMELKHAPAAWRLAFEAWVIVATSIILAGWWLSSGR